MKRLTVPALLACSLISSSAQDAAKMEVVLERKQETVVQPGQSGKATKLELKKQLEFEGFLADLGKTNNAVKIFDLTEPVDVKKEKQRIRPVSPTVRMGREARGWVLWSLRF